MLGGVDGDAFLRGRGHGGGGKSERGDEEAQFSHGDS